MINEIFFNEGSAPFSWKARLKSFMHAWAGIVWFFKTGHNAQIHLAASVLAVALSVTLGVNKSEAIAIVFSIAFVWIAEMINTAIEKAMDFISVEKHPQIKMIKDISAGAVLVAATAACVVDGIIFLPKMFML